MKNTQGKPLERARSKRGDLPIKKKPTSVQPSHLQSLGSDGTKAQEGVCRIGEGAGVWTMMPIIATKHTSEVTFPTVSEDKSSVCRVGSEEER